MRFYILTIGMAVAILFIGCKSDSTSSTEDEIQPVETITGTLTVGQQWQGENIIIAFLPDYFIYYNENVITDFDEDPPYTILKSITVTAAAASETYSIDIPSDKKPVKALIAWVDIDGDGGLNFNNDEAVRFPSKNHDEEGIVEVVRWSYGINGMDNDFSLTLEQDGTFLTSDFLPDMGGDGFNFTF